MRYKIKEFRLKKGMTQEELAKEAECSRQYLNELENTDARNVSSWLLLRISRVLGVSLEEIFLNN